MPLSKAGGSPYIPAAMMYFGKAIALLLPLLFTGHVWAQCPIELDSLTDKFGVSWTGKISTVESTWPNISIAQEGRGTYSPNYRDLTKLVWEGVTNAKECYYDPGMAAYSKAKRLFDEANARNPSNPDPNMLMESREQYQRAIDLFQQMKPQVEDLPKYDKQYLFSESRKYMEVAVKMVPKLNSVLHFNDGFTQFQEAINITKPGEIQRAIGLLGQSKANLATAAQNFADAAKKVPAQAASMNKKARQARTLMNAGDRISSYLGGTERLFNIQNLKGAKSHELQSLMDGIGRNNRIWRGLRDELGPILKGDKLQIFSDQLEERRREADNIMAFRENLNRANQQAKVLMAGVGPKLGLQNFDGAKSDLRKVNTLFNGLDREFANPSEEAEISAVQDEVSCNLKEIDFKERVVRLDRLTKRGMNSALEHEALTEAMDGYRSLSRATDNVDDLCADKPWVADTRDTADAQMIVVQGHMEEQDWIKSDDGEFKAPILKNFQAELDNYTDADLTQGDNLKQAAYYHNKVMQVVAEERNIDQLSDEQKSGNARYLIAHGKLLRDKKDFDKAKQMFSAVGTYYGSTPESKEASKEGWITFALKNIVLLGAIAGLTLLTLLFLLFRGFSPKVIEKKQRNKLEILEEKKKMAPEKKLKAFSPIIGKFEKLEKKKKLTRNGKAYAKKAYVNKGVCHLRVGQKDQADKSFSRAEHFQRVEPEEILPALAYFHLKKGNTDESAMETYAEYLNLPPQYVSERLERDIQDLVNNAEVNVYEPPPKPAPGERFTTAEIDLDGAVTPPPAPGAPPPPPSSGATMAPPPPPSVPKVKKKIKKKTVIVRKKK